MAVEQESAVRGAATLTADRYEEMKQYMSEWKITGVVVLRDGTNELECFDNGSDEVSSVYSCTKSVLSALIGIALDKGMIDSVHDPISRYLPELLVDDSDLKHSITIADLLTMTSGLEWEEFDKPYWDMKKHEDPAKFTFEQSLLHKPGSVFAYNSGGSHVLAVLLRKVSGLEVAEFAKDHLFQPLGIRDYKWNHLHGTSEGGTGLHLYLKDLALFGSLYLNKGAAEGRQLISQEWVDQSTTAHHKGFIDYKPNIFGSYGYHWWVSPESKDDPLDYYFALGYGGQYLFVVPSLATVVAIRKIPYGGRHTYMYCKQLLYDYVLPLLNVK